ncbi:GNAT family N-acetyltransferase [Duganella sp. FT50W]|uniref:GNAT family N-acetyltransferase n=1 Tax=Duganella lactea TaxID=2692173 RepID=A0A6L8ML17_9BURK|nr:GNAT family N-acetyltransferase [Duganella lactea]MYM81165.1 GNAT family N-acetyltransferase [Duganella lactea]
MFTVAEHLRLRNSHEGDAPFRRALYAATRDDLRQLPMSPQFIDNLISMQQKIHEDGQRNAFPRAQHWIVEYHDEAVGRVVFDMSGAEWRLVDIAIAPAARRQGVAGAVLRALQRRAAGQRAAISLAVAHGNDGARRLYAAAGFQPQASDALRQQMLWQCPC